MKYYLVTINGVGNATRKLVGPKTWKWILSSPKELNTNEAIPEDALVEMERLSGEKQEPTVYINFGRWDNDRAIYAGGKEFDNVKEAMKWLKENNSELDDEYHCCIY